MQHQLATSLFPSIVAQVSGTGVPAILLLHGFPADSSLWRLVAPKLANDYTVIVPDIPGVGQSATASKEVSMEALAQGMRDLLNSLNIDKAIIVGHSMGGYIALAFAAQFPERVLGLSLVHSTAKADDDAKKETRRKAIALIEKGGKQSFIHTTTPPLFGETFRKEEPDMVFAQITQAMTVPDASLITFYNAMINRKDYTEALVQATFPVQWIIGAQDTIIPPEKTMQQTSLSSVSFVGVYKNCGHMSMLEAPQQLAADLYTFTAYCSKRQMKEK